VRFEADPKELKRAVALAKKVLPRGSSLPGSDGIKVDVAGSDVSFTASTGDLTVQVPLAGGIQDGTVIVPGRTFADVVAVVNGAVTVSTDAKDFVIEDDFGSLRMERHDADFDFPVTPDPAKRLVALDETFPAAVAQVVVAASDDYERPIITGVLIEAEGDGMRLVATDSYRLAFRDVPGEPPKKPILVPANALRLLTKATWVRYGTKEGWVTFESDLGRVSARLIEGDFPAHRKLFEPVLSLPSVAVDRQSFLNGIARTRPFQTQAWPVEVSVGSTPEVAIDSPRGRVRTSLAVAAVRGEAEPVRFNPRFLREGVSACGDTVDVTFAGPVKPALFGSGDFRYLLMPVRLPS
jgi:DNA polymerase-3 subunit beta